MIEATCHCGAVRVEANRRPTKVTSCNCSICHRYGTLWAYYTRKSARLVSAPDRVAAYIWGDRCIEFYHCTTCGCVTHYESAEKTPDSRFAINARNLDPALLEHAAVRHFDGRDTWTYRER
jgi:hypothetical protein